MFDMFSEANRYAAMVREVFDALTRAGFTEEQAMRIMLNAMGPGR